MNETGRNQVDLYLEIIAATNGEIAQVPGYPPLYDYELYPQQVPDMSVQGSVIFTMMGAESIEASDGVICIATSALERETVIACKDYYKSVGKEFFTIGPMSMIRTPEQHENEVTSQVVLFLDKIQAELGEKSVIYISFGTFWWPSDPTIFEAIIKELVSLKMPFILSHPSPLCQFSDELRQIISESPYALELVWSPQERILTHPATGWFLTHGGWNSVQEALEYKVPLIFWPFGADQPLNSALITCQHKAGFELLEVRTGEKGKQKPYRCKDESCPSFTVDSGTKEVMDLLQELKGEKGRTVRTNWEDLANQCGKVWEENGEARLELFRLLEKYLD
ncbi:hypothetical protein MPER_12101 [Moniliophthora perniciosa FA553]|nr:hypothetical protein MPER_12101 [Moniliophthora perniciosa FA553]